jgi:hypothetical protein
MKIHQLPMGARFEYEEREYTKTGPQIGSGAGGQRLIPKYAVLKALDGMPPPAPPRGPLAREAVLAAFERFHAACATLVPEERRDDLAAARAEFLKTLD